MGKKSDFRHTNQGQSLHARCPHCKAAGKVYSSRQITELYKQFYIQCRNPECAHAWLAELMVVHTITPSACPNPTLQIRNGPTLAQMVKAAGQGGPAPPALAPAPANDDGPEQELKQGG